jgi:hypothetical protein
MVASMNEDQRGEWRKAIADHHRKQRQQRGRRDASSYRPGMARISPASPHNDAMSSLPRCPFRGCPIRYRGGPDRPCPAHQAGDGIDGIAERMAQFAIQLEDGDGDGDGDGASRIVVRPDGPLRPS